MKINLRLKENDDTHMRYRLQWVAEELGLFPYMEKGSYYKYVFNSGRKYEVTAFLDVNIYWYSIERVWIDESVQTGTLDYDFGTAASYLMLEFAVF